MGDSRGLDKTLWPGDANFYWSKSLFLFWHTAFMRNCNLERQLANAVATYGESWLVGLNLISIGGVWEFVPADSFCLPESLPRRRPTLVYIRKENYPFSFGVKWTSALERYLIWIFGISTTTGDIGELSVIYFNILRVYSNKTLIWIIWTIVSQSETLY